MLRPLHDRKSLVVLGMNSGTSADGLDLAALRITQLAGSHRPGLRFQFLDGQTTSYPEDIRSLIIEAADTPNISVDRVILLDNLLGQFFGSAAARYVRKLSRKGLTVDAIASHGQTVRHLPQLTKLAGLRIRGTLQIGGLAHIAARSGLVTVGDFRQGDIALGGEGARRRQAHAQKPVQFQEGRLRFAA